MGADNTFPLQPERLVDVLVEYGSVVPWVSRQEDRRLELTAGPDRLIFETRVALRGADLRTIGEFDVVAGNDRRVRRRGGR